MSAEKIPTPSSTVGPFLHIGLTDRHSLTHIAGPKVKGERVHLKCRVLDAEGAPVNDAMIEIWQADADGKYNHPDDPGGASKETFRGFGRAATDEIGCCEFDTIKPGRVAANIAVHTNLAGVAATAQVNAEAHSLPSEQLEEHKLQAPHVNLAIFARGILLQLYTRIYFAGDPANDDDPILALVPKERRPTLLAQPDPSRRHGWLFEIRLRGEDETVFFDV